MFADDRPMIDNMKAEFDRNDYVTTKQECLKIKGAFQFS